MTLKFAKKCVSAVLLLRVQGVLTEGERDRILTRIRMKHAATKAKLRP